jgi:hypothetical protein
MTLTKTPKSYVKRLDVFYTVAEGIIVSADIQSKSREGLLHYTRLVVDPLTMKIIRASCDCEGFVFKGRCWHIETLKQLIDSDERVREEIMKVKRIEENTTS